MTTATETSDSILLQNILSAQVTRNLNNTALVQKAHSLPHCKKNIMLTLLMFWDKVFTDITDILIHKRNGSKRCWDVNSECLEYLVENNLANTTFVKFFFKYHKALTQSFLSKLQRELNNGMSYHRKFAYLTEELSELLNLAYIELSGLRISCETFGGEALCLEAKHQTKSDCGKVDNIICFMVNDEHMLNPELLRQTLENALPDLKTARDEMIMILDYRNLAQSNYIFDKKARERYELARSVFKAIYLYHCNMGMKFGEGFKGLEPFLIPDKNGLKRVVKSWRDEKELITFEKGK